MNTILITLDCARADWLECNGGNKNLAPYINDLALQGAIFKNAITAANSTSSSHVSILTSTYPYIHEVRGNGMVFNCSQIPILAEVLSRQGIKTAAFVSVEQLSSYFGLCRGFDKYFNNNKLDKLFYLFTKSKIKIFGRSLLNILSTLRNRFSILGSHYKDGSITLKEAIKFLRRNNKSNFFLWVHFFDAHNYSTRAEYNKKIQYVDGKVKKLIEETYKYIPREEVFIVITGDHGEAFNEHGLERHGTSLYDEVVRVPLIMVLPKKIQPNIIQEQIRTIDIAPTILDFYLIDKPRNWQGISLYSVLVEKKPFMPRDALTYSYTLKLNAKSLRSKKWKMIYYVDMSNYSIPAYEKKVAYTNNKIELYDIENDKDEKNNLVKNNEKIISELKARFFDLENMSSRVYEQEDFNLVIKKRLEALGYL